MPRAVQAQCIGGLRHGGAVVATVTAGSDGFDPAAHVGQCFAGQHAQRHVHVRRLRQAGVEELLARPCCVAEVAQPQHARAALQGVKGAAHGGHVLRVVGVGLQPLDGGAGVGHDFARLFDEDVAHLGVVFEPGAALGRGLRWRHHGPWRGHFGRGAREAGHGCGQFCTQLAPCHRVDVAAQPGAGTRQQAAELGLVCRQGLLRQALGIVRQCAVTHRGLRRRHAQGLHLVDQGRLLRRRRESAVRNFVKLGKGRDALGLAHDRAQAAGFGVEAEERLGQLRLHAEHVDQEAERTQVVGQAVEGAGLDGALRIDFGLRQGIDVVAHVQRRLRGLLHAQHRQHAAHRRQLRRHRNQQVAVGRRAEVLVDLLLDLGQRGAQFLHHAAHGLAVGDAAIQLLHPHVQRLRVCTLAHVVDAPRQALHATAEFDLIEFAVFERRVEVEDAGGDFHRQGRWRRLAR